MSHTHTHTHTQAIWSAEDAARLYVKVASCYYDNSSSEVKRAVGETLGEW